MRGRLLNLPAVARALGFVFVAIAIVAAALHFRTRSQLTQPHPAEAAATPDSLADDLERCRLLAEQAKDDPACEAAWAESRRRFFTYAPASAPAPAAPATNTNR